MTFYTKVGAFTQPGSTGNLAVTGVGFTPKALILWGESHGAWGSNYCQSVAYVTASGCGAICASSVNNTNNSTTHHRHAAVAYTVMYNGTVYAEATYVSFNADGFTLDWTTANASGQTVNYLALGGTDLTNTKVKQWTETSGTQSVTGVGFQPDLVLHLSTWDTSAPPTTATSADIQLGAMDKNGNQWASHVTSPPSFNPTGPARIQLTNKCYIGYDKPASAVYEEAHWSAMGADGFTVVWDIAHTANVIYSLCLKGGKFTVGNWAKSTGGNGSVDTISGLGYTPQAVFQVTDCYTASSSVQNSVRQVIGASDGSDHQYTAIQEKYNVSPSVVSSSDGTLSLEVCDNDLKSDDAWGAMGNFTSGQFQAQWTKNNNVATQICYVVFGTSVTNLTPASSETATLTAGETKTIAIAVAESETVTGTAHETLGLAVATTSACTATLNAHEADGVFYGNQYVVNSTETAVLVADESTTLAIDLTVEEDNTCTAYETGTPNYSGNTLVTSTEVATLTEHETSSVALRAGETHLGRIWFAGVDVTQAPYYGSMTPATRYGFLDGYTSTQFTTSPQSVVNSKPYAKDWLRHIVLRSIAPDNDRKTLMASIIALATLFDPTKGEQQLIFEEYLGSFFIAQSQTSILANEQLTPQMTEYDIDLACTGPAYSIQESVSLISGNSTQFRSTITSNGDSPASPVWRIHVGLGGKNRFRITNTTTGESVVWGMANVAFGDIIEFNMDAEYGTPYTILQNGVPAVDTYTGPAWPHLIPGANVIEIRQEYPAPTIVEARFRDRFEVGQRDYPAPVVTPTVRLPTEILFSGVDTPRQPGSYIFSGSVQDVYFNGVPNVPVKLYVSTPVSGLDVAWSIAGNTTTDANGNYTFSSTGVVGHRVDFKAVYGGSLSYFPSTSVIIPATPPGTRLVTNCDIKRTGTDPYYEFYGALNSSAGYVKNATLYLQISIDPFGTTHHANYWRNAAVLHDGDVPVDATDNKGNYGFFYTPGWGIQYFRTYYPGDLLYQPCYSSGTGTDVITLTENNPWPAQSPGPVDYWVSMNQTMVDSGRLQYFASLGFTKCVFIANQNDVTDVYAAELAMIKALGMTPYIDIEYVVEHGEWNTGNFSVYTTWIQNLVAAGWTIMAAEAGWPGCLDYLQSEGVQGYINYGIDKGPLTFTWNNGGVITTVEGMYIHPLTVANSWECYFDSQIGPSGQNEVMGGITASSLLGISNGIIMGVWSGSTNEIYNNSISGTTPNGTVGNTYQSIFDWSYENGRGLDHFEVFFYPWNQKQGMNYFFDLSCDSLVTDLQATYPPNNTDQLIAPTVFATNLTFDWMLNTDGSYSFSSDLTNLYTGDPMVGKEVTLMVSPDNSTWAPVAVSGGLTNPTPTDSMGHVAWNNLRFASGTYYFLVQYTGDATHMPISGGYEGAYGTGVTVP